MTTQQGTRPSARFESSPTQPASGFASNRAIGLYVAGCLTLAVIAAALLLSSCGQNHSADTRTAIEPNTAGATTVDAVPAALTAPPSSPSSGEVVAQARPAEGLPPEIAIGEMASVVAPGEPISITVYGTPDVTEMSLWDGLNDRQAFVHDQGSDIWRVDYRVPLRPKSERVGLSVTARNDLGRWRRVWVFLQVASAAQASESPAPVDSVMEK